MGDKRVPKTVLWCGRPLIILSNGPRMLRTSVENRLSHAFDALQIDPRHGYVPVAGHAEAVVLDRGELLGGHWCILV